MKRFLIFSLVFLSIASLTSAAVQREETASLPVMVSPKVLPFLGTTEAVLNPAIYPDFYNFEPPASGASYASCENYLRAKWTSTRRGFAQPGLSSAPIQAISSQGNGTANGADIDGQYQDLLWAGSEPTISIAIDDTTRTKVLVVWSLRVEGTLAAYPITPRLCQTWLGKSYQSFSSGDVSARLFIQRGGNWVAKGQETKMTLPEGGVREWTQAMGVPAFTMPMFGIGVGAASDPTIVGSSLITAQDFGGSLPAQLKLKLMWCNHTSMRVRTPANMRSLIVTLIPVEATSR